MASFGSSQAKPNSLLKLKPFEDENNQLRVGGRLTNAPIPFEAKHPVILPNNHHVTQLIISHYHLRLGHAGPERVLAEIRQRFWILKGRAVINQTLKSCLQCHKLRAKPQTQQMADLPDSRVTPGEPPFTRVGIDYFGPFLVKKARSELKRYGCLFTCLTTRAIHLEVALTLDTDSFINALQRFIARRGPPTEIRSDNGTNFVCGLRELRKAISEWNQQKISDYLLQNNVKWIFNPPAASHMGGVWERQIRTVRSILNTVLLQQAPDDESLTTLFCCVESIVNGRPITKLSDDPSDPLPLTPNHLLLLRSGPTLPPGAFVKQDLYRHRWPGTISRRCLLVQMAQGVFTCIATTPKMATTKAESSSRRSRDHSAWKYTTQSLAVRSDYSSLSRCRWTGAYCGSENTGGSLQPSCRQNLPPGNQSSQLNRVS